MTHLDHLGLGKDFFEIPPPPHNQGYIPQNYSFRLDQVLAYGYGKPTEKLVVRSSPQENLLN